MPLDCGFLCLLTDRRRYCEILWRRRLLITNDEKKAKRRFLALMRGFDAEDLEVLKRAVESGGHDIKQCCPGPPMDLVEDDDDDSLLGPPQGFPTDARTTAATTVLQSNRNRHSINRLEHDRVLFQRQKFGSTNPTAAVAPSPHQRRYSQKRRASSYSRRYAPPSIRTFDENYNALDMPPLPSPSGNSGSDDGRDALVDEHKRPSTSSSSRQRALPPPDDFLAESPYDDCGLIPQIDRPMSMPYLCAKMWRWKELQVDAALHRLDPMPWCRFGRVTINNATVSCCNPYHYGLWIRPENSLSSSADEIPLEGFSPVGVLANGGGPFAALMPTTARDPRSTTREASGGALCDAESMIAGIGHVRAAFKTADAINTTRAAFAAAFNETDNVDDDVDSPPPVPPPPIPPLLDVDTNELAALGVDIPAITIDHFTFPNHIPSLPTIHAQAMAWGRMARWERKERIGDVVTMVGEFVAVGKLAGTVYDGQDVKLPWDIENSVSFALIRQSEGDDYEDIWLYNSGDRSLFIALSKTLGSQRSDTIRRLSPGYCIRVHRTPIGERTASEQPLINFVANSARRSTATTFTPDPVAAAIMSNSVSFLTISVGAGWGVNYQRLHVTECPVRYEVIFT